MIRRLFEQTWIFLVMSLSLGLAPFFPEPHIWGKIRWIAGGAVGMAPIDWFDFFLHGTPWLLLAISVAMKFMVRKKS